MTISVGNRILSALISRERRFHRRIDARRMGASIGGSRGGGKWEALKLIRDQEWAKMSMSSQPATSSTARCGRNSKQALA